MLPDFVFLLFSPVQKATSGIGHRLKSYAESKMEVCLECLVLFCTVLTFLLISQDNYSSDACSLSFPSLIMLQIQYLYPSPMVARP